MLDITLSCRVPAQTSLFETALRNQSKENVGSQKYCSCARERNGEALQDPACSFNSRVQPLEARREYWTAIHQSVGTVRRAVGDGDIGTDDDDFEDDYVFQYSQGDYNYSEPSWPTKSGLTESKAYQLCKDALYGSTVAQACMASRLLKPSDNDTLIRCMEDIKVHVLIKSCLFMLFSNTSHVVRFGC